MNINRELLRFRFSYLDKIFNFLLDSFKKEINEAGNGARDEDFVIYEDYSPFMMISQASLDELNTKLPRRLTMRSFRPNFTANNVERPFGEVLLLLSHSTYLLR